MGSLLYLRDYVSSLSKINLLTCTKVTPHTESLGRNEENPDCMSNFFFISLINHCEYVLFLRRDGEWEKICITGKKQDDNRYVFECKYGCFTGLNIFWWKSWHNVLQ